LVYGLLLGEDSIVGSANFENIGSIFFAGGCRETQPEEKISFPWFDRIKHPGIDDGADIADS